MLSTAAASLGDVPAPVNSSTVAESVDVDWTPQAATPVADKASVAMISERLNPNDCAFVGWRGRRGRSDISMDEPDSVLNGLNAKLPELFNVVLHGFEFFRRILRY